MSESLANPRSLSHQEAVRAFSDQSLFENKTWRYSPEAFPLSSAQIRQIEEIGQACYEFYKAQETLYLRSTEGKNLLRNLTSQNFSKLHFFVFFTHFLDIFWNNLIFFDFFLETF